MSEHADSDGGRASSREPRPPHQVRRVVIAAGVLLVLVIVLLAARMWLRPKATYGGDLEAGERYGIDVSGHQNAIDWERVSGDGIDFAYIKATEGGDFVDARFAANWDGAASAGLDRGAYHFFTLCRPGADQADNFLRTVPHDPNALPPVVDLEFVGNCAGRPTKEALLHELTTFVERVEASTGQRVTFYLMDDFDQQYGVRAALDRGAWVRHLNERPPSADWLIWQRSDVAVVAGIDGDVDLDVMKNGS
jgi:lysozyme